MDKKIKVQIPLISGMLLIFITLKDKMPSYLFYLVSIVYIFIIIYLMISSKKKDKIL